MSMTDEDVAVSDSFTWSDITALALFSISIIHCVIVMAQVHNGPYGEETVFQQIARILSVGKIIRPSEWFFASIFMACYSRLGKAVVLLRLGARNQVSISNILRRKSEPEEAVAPPIVRRPPGSLGLLLLALLCGQAAAQYTPAPKPVKFAGEMPTREEYSHLGTYLETKKINALQSFDEPAFSLIVPTADVNAIEHLKQFKRIRSIWIHVVPEDIVPKEYRRCTETSLLRELAKLQNFENIRISGDAAREDLEIISEMTWLQGLSFVSPKTLDRDLIQLKDLKELRQLSIGGQTSEKGRQDLLRNLPHAKIISPHAKF